MGTSAKNTARKFAVALAMTALVGGAAATPALADSPHESGNGNKNGHDNGKGKANGHGKQDDRNAPVQCVGDECTIEFDFGDPTPVGVIILG